MKCPGDHAVVVLGLIIASLCGHGASFDLPTVDVRTKTGLVRGQTQTVATAGNRKVDVFLGIPYVEPPVGDLRFEPPEYPHKPWTSVRTAFAHGPSCIQDEKSQHIPGEKSEDCLYLNVFAALRPENVSSLPVMIWIYGGGFRSGSSTIYPGNLLATLGQEVVLVTLNYRLGALGFLASTDRNLVPGNMGLKDQLAAMQWVRDNIAAFGGDPERVTIFGESAGGASVSLHLLSPKSSGMFIRAIAESGTALCPWASAMQAERSAAAVELAEVLHCSVGNNVSLACLRAASAESILDAQDSVYSSWEAANRGTPFIPVIDGDFLPLDPVTALKTQKFNKVDLLSGVNHDEWALFVEGYVNNSNPGVPVEKFFSEITKYINLGYWGFPDIRGNGAVVESIKFAYVDWFNPSSDYQRLQQLIKAGSDFKFMCPFQTTASYWSAAANLYMYQFSHTDATHPKWAGVPHAAEVFYIFGLPLLLPLEVREFLPKGISADFPYNDNDKLVSHDIIRIWKAFAWTGNPSGGLPADAEVQDWPLYSVESRPYVDLDTHITQGSFLHNDMCELFSQLAPTLLQDCQTRAQSTHQTRHNYVGGR